MLAEPELIDKTCRHCQQWPKRMDNADRLCAQSHQLSQHCLGLISKRALSIVTQRVQLAAMQTEKQSTLMVRLSLLFAAHFTGRPSDAALTYGDSSPT